MTFPDHEEERTLTSVRAAVDDVRLSTEARARIGRRLASGGAGATTLRAGAGRRSMRAAWIVAGGMAAAALAAIFLLPAIDRRTTVSAAEVLGRSQEALTAPISGGEILTYDLTLGGVLEQLLPNGQAGRFTVQETVDHDHEGRFRIVKLATDGQMAAGVANDPLAHTRAHYFRLDNRGYLLRVTAAQQPVVSLVAARRFAMQGLMAVMQTSDRKSLREVDRMGESAYAIDVPEVSTGVSMITLRRAHVVIAREDARVLDFEANGTFGGQPFAIAFSLRTRESRPAEALSPADFTIDALPGDEILDASGGSGLPIWDLIGRCLGR